MANVSLRNINKIYPNGVQAVFDFNLEIQDKDFIVLVGPSGCGKSTTLRMVAGLEEITSGELYIDEELMNDVPAKNRSIAMVFQSYALYPHMTVFDNMAFGLKLRKVPKDEIKRRIEEVAETLGLTPFLSRKPKALSGGQRQRVALGRAIVRDAKVFLFDEPLSNLDAKLRVQMRTEIARIHKNIQATSLYVTHDQIEAMTMASRIVVMKDGYIQQIGTPKEIYNAPANVFVGSFIGTPSMNFLPGKINEDGNFITLNGTVCLPLSLEHKKVIAEKEAFQKEVLLGIRPEDVFLASQPEQDTTIEVEVELLEMLGHEANLHFKIDDTPMICIVNSRILIDEGSKVGLTFDMDHCHIFDNETQLRIC
ncbi:MAG: sn-glycerol-3-phosphate ABC transporter ATP-binding protein UgpC [Roseburia sp.]|nr:sn-glycerol-3-phosphate ABC transporter ATP-binding protein UgpC [Anaeroplasma bactoclasticum]MCM1195614.1 sn-glycerol-3-phosphate ABC transporter ATP-binding protein UgpC [Roseburia sp.]MCM1556204.1 sn-glycerol-3-phosphate ABC transporter ATP-binding protein UgpC [Anaeroplasma bactoclasticum]